MSENVTIRRHFGTKIGSEECEAFRLFPVDSSDNPSELHKPSLIPVYDFNITVFRYSYTEEKPKFYVNSICQISPREHVTGFTYEIFYSVLRPLLMKDPDIVVYAKRESGELVYTQEEDADMWACMLECDDEYDIPYDAGEEYYANPDKLELAYICGWDPDCGETMDQVIENQIG